MKCKVDGCRYEALTQVGKVYCQNHLHGLNMNKGKSYILSFIKNVEKEDEVGRAKRTTGKSNR